MEAKTYSTRAKEVTEFQIQLVKTFNDLIKRYNQNEPGINFIELRDFENFIVNQQGIDLPKVNKIINSKK